MSKEQKADWKGFDWNGAENCELRKYVSSLEIQLAKVTRERDEAQAREAAVIDRLKAEIAKCQWCGGKGTYTDTIGENTYSGKCIHCEPYQDMLATLQDPSHACDVWKAMKAELEARREVMTQMCFNEGYGDQAQFDAAWAKLEKALAALEEVQAVKRQSSQLPLPQITISEPVMEILRRAAAKDKMNVNDFISQQLALVAGILAERGWADLPSPPEEEVNPLGEAGIVPTD